MDGDCQMMSLSLLALISYNPSVRRLDHGFSQHSLELSVNENSSDKRGVSEYLQVPVELNSNGEPAHCL